MVDFTVIIPARYHSSRLPGKVLLDIAGKPMIQHVYERAVQSGAQQVVIATDDERVCEVAETFGAEVCMTLPEHESGTERVAEAALALECDDEDIIVNVQGDEPLISPGLITQVAMDLEEHTNVKVATACETINNIQEIFDPNVVKVVLNHRGYALYFSRAPIPWERGVFENKANAVLQDAHFRHIGIYAYRAGFLQTFIEWDDCPLGQLEQLEQLRILWHGGRIHTTLSKHKTPPGVDTEADLKRVLEFF